MVLKTQLNALLNKKMNREQFIKHVGIGIVALSGAGSALKLLTPQQKKAPVSVESGYGGSAYGGMKQ